MRYHFQRGVTKDKKRGKWVLWLLFVALIAAGAYGVLLFLAPQFVSNPLGGGAADATYQKFKNSQAGQFGDRLFIPQLNVDVAIESGGDAAALRKGAWHRHTEGGDPAKGGNFALSARKFSWGLTPQAVRNNSPFFNLHKLNVGDELHVDFLGQRYSYKISQKYSINANSDKPEEKSDEAKLTLYAVDDQGQAVAGEVIEAKIESPVTKESSNSSILSDLAEEIDEAGE